MVSRRIDFQPWAAFGDALRDGARLIPLTQGKFAIVDAEDYE